MVIIHSFTVPFFWIDETGPYVIDDRGRTNLPKGTTSKDIKWFRRPHRGGKNEAFKIQVEWDIEGSGKKNYKVSVDGKAWSCDCHAFKFSGNKRSCKHIDEIKSSYLS